MATTTIPRSRRDAIAKRWQRGRSGYMFLIPWLIGFFALTLGPALASLYLAFTKYDVLTPPVFTGLDNFGYMFFQDYRFRQALQVTFTYVLWSVPLKLGLALLIAIALDKGTRGVDLYRAIFYLPSLIGGSVAIAVLWRQLFDRDGLTDQLLQLLGWPPGTSLLNNPDHALKTLIVLSVWQFGAPMVIFLAGLRQIPQHLHEAARMDGAKTMQRFSRITLPLLAPVIFFNLIMQTIDAFKAFTQAFVVSAGTGGPIDSTLFYTLYLYQEGFAFFRMGYASALAWFLLIIIAAFTALTFLSAKYWVHYDDGR
ncbi:carbohydrate ABC transporter permease [Devosia geojensis]|uniref:carbohydrate ABC transporter permease n=1 Tax=Devosia geojensis TaxID=443610 RepID=UPI000A044E9F